MSSATIYVTPHTLTAGYCFTSLQDLLDTFSSHQSVTLPVGATEIIVSASTPGPADQDKVWLKVDGVGNPVNFYWFNGGSWKEVNPPNVFWGLCSNVLNAYTVAVAKPPPALVTGMLFLFKVPTANTGAATLQVNAFGAFPFNGAGVALTSGQLVVNSYIGAVWTGTTFELFGAASPFVSVSQITPGTEGQFVRTRTGVAVWETPYVTVSIDPVNMSSGIGVVGPFAHGLGVDPDIVQWKLVCKTPEHGYVADDWVPLTSAFTADSGNDNQVYTPNVNATNYSMARYVEASGVFIANGTTGVHEILTNGNWKIVGKFFRLS